jgi:hypothetical protein
MTRKALPDMNKGELKEIIIALKIPFEDNDTNAVLVQRIQESGKYNPTKETRTGKIKANEKGERIHPILGKYYDVIVHPTGATNANTSIFVSIGLYTAEFQPREKVSLPAKVIKFLKQPGRPEHYYDPHVISDNGNVGAHMTRYVPKYIVERADQED